jgi:arsenite methyltransferase
MLDPAARLSVCSEPAVRSDGGCLVGAWEFVAGQLRSPSGTFGRYVMPRFFNRSSAAINQTTLAALALEPEDRVLEVGFGGGELIASIEPFIPEGSVAGVDFSPDMVGAAAKRFASLVQAGRVEVRCARAEELPYADGRFTKACTVNTVYFWPDPAVPLRELSRVLEAGGRLVVSFSIPAAIQGLPFTKHGFTLYEPDQVRGLLEDAGFGAVRMVPGTGRRGDYMCAIAIKQEPVPAPKARP